MTKADTAVVQLELWIAKDSDHASSTLEQFIYSLPNWTLSL